MYTQFSFSNTVRCNYLLICPFSEGTKGKGEAEGTKKGS